MLTKEKYLNSLKNELLTFGLSNQKVNIIISDYEEYFDSAYENDEIDSSIIESLGTVKILAEKILAEESETTIPHVQLSLMTLLHYPIIIIPTFLYGCLLLITYLLQAFEVFFIFSPLILLIGLLAGLPAQGGVLFQSLIAIVMTIVAITAFKFTRKGKLLFRTIFKQYLWNKIS